MIPTKATDQFPTDAWLLRVFEGWFDPCPLAVEPGFDGLTVPWGGRTYVNPPYSSPLPWVRKGIAEHQRGKIVVFLLKFDSTTEWYRELVQAGAHIIHIGERLHHGHSYAAPFPSMLAVLS
jgi:hypothetical protein